MKEYLINTGARAAMTMLLMHNCVKSKHVKNAIEYANSTAGKAEKDPHTVENYEAFAAFGGVVLISYMIAEGLTRKKKANQVKNILNALMSQINDDVLDDLDGGKVGFDFPNMGENE